jgi:uncharacterized repeat protein (TIGR01451 family)
VNITKLSFFGILWRLSFISCISASSTWAQTAVFNYTGTVQSYTLPPGATGIKIQAAGAGGGGAGADANGPGGPGGSGATVSGVYSAASGTALNVYVGGGGGPGFTSNFGHTCANSAGAGGSSGGVGGYAGGAGGAAGCVGWSGSGGGGGAASVVTTAANAALVVAGGGSGGQGGSWNSTAASGQNSTLLGVLPASAGNMGASPGAGSDGGGGGGGGAGCPGGVGGVLHVDNTGTTSDAPAGAGTSCANSVSVSNFMLLPTPGGLGGGGAPASTGAPSDPGGQAGLNGSINITPLFPVLGNVYADPNHNAALDAAETGTGLAGLYIKLAPSVSGICQTTATAAALVNTATGAYSLVSVLPGSYCLTLTNTSALSNTTPHLPAGWLHTEAASGVRQITVAGSASATQNFGLYNGSQLTLRVFGDTGVGAGTANDGVQNGGETGLSGITVKALLGVNTIDSAVTNASGSALLWLPSSISGSVVVIPTVPAGYLATGGSPGTTAGSYARPSVNGSVSFTFGGGNSYSGVAFGLVPPNTFMPDGLQSTQAGSVVFYPHTYTAGSAGQLTFSTAAVSAPALAGWSETLLLDPSCSGQLTGSNLPIVGQINVVAGQRVCILVREFVPSTAPLNAENKVVVNASIVYSGSAAPAINLVSRVDTTTVDLLGALLLNKKVQNLTLATAYSTNNTALPGHTLQYQLTITNQSASAVSTVVINDTTPAFTTFLSAACPVAALPVNLTACSVSVQPAVGAPGGLQWTFTGNLASGGSTVVTYQVKVVQ